MKVSRAERYGFRRGTGIGKGTSAKEPPAALISSVCQPAACSALVISGLGWPAARASRTKEWSSLAIVIYYLFTAFYQLPDCISIIFCHILLTKLRFCA